MEELKKLLAEQLNITKKTISNYLLGNSFPDAETQKVIYRWMTTES